MNKTTTYSTGKTIKYIIVYFLLFLAGDLFSALFFDLTLGRSGLTANIMFMARALGYLALAFLLFFLYTKYALHRRLSDFRVAFSLSTSAVLCSLVLPVLVTGVFALIGETSINPEMSKAGAWGAVFASACLALRAGILEEMLFRGFIMKLVEDRWDKITAILAPSFVFSLVHIPSMETITLGGVALLIVSGTLVGIMLSLLTYKNATIIGSVFVHVVWNFTMVTDVLRVVPAGDTSPFETIFLIRLPSDSILLTGGGFGAEASIVSIAGFALVCLWAICSLMRKSKSASGTL